MINYILAHGNPCIKYWSLVHVTTKWMVKRQEAQFQLITHCTKLGLYHNVDQHYLLFENWMVPIWTNFNLLHLKMFCAKFGWNWLSDSGKDVYISSIHFLIISPCKRERCFIWTLLKIPFIQGCFMPKVEIVKTGSDSSTAKRSAIGVSVTGPRRWPL